MTAYLEDLVARVRLDTSGLQAGMASATSSLQSGGARMASVGSNLTRSLTLPLAGAAAAGIKLAADFDTTMRKVGIATGKATGPLRELAMTMGAETQYSAGEASDAMLELAKSGMTAAQIQAGALKSTMTLASAGGVELGESATYVSNAMAQFSIKARNAKDVAVALAGGANASSASVSSLGQGLSQVGGIAASAGMSLQETVGTLSAFDAAGLKGSDAGTSLKAMLNTLIPTTEKAETAMEGLGLMTEEGNNAFLKANGDFEDMSTIAGRLQEALEGASEGQRNLALETIFGSDGMRAANALAQTGADGLNRYERAAFDAATAQELANVGMEGMTGAIEKAKGSLETAAIVLGTALAPAVEKVAGWVEAAANAFSDLSPQMQTTVAVVGAVLAALGPLLFIGGKIVSSVGKIAGAFAVLTGPLGIAAVVATAVGGAVAAVSAGDPKLRRAVSGLVSAIKEGDWDEAWSEFKTVATRTFNGVRDAAGRFVGRLVPKIMNGLGGLKQDWEGWWATFWKPPDKAYDRTERRADTFNDRMVRASGRTGASVVAALITQLNKMPLMSSNIMVDVVANLRTGLEGAPGVAGRAGANVVAALARSLRGGDNAASAAAIQIAGAIRQGLEVAINSALSIGVNIVMSLARGIASAASTAAQAAVNVVTDALKAARDVIGMNSPAKAWIEVGEVGIGGGLVTGMNRAMGRVSAAARALVPTPGSATLPGGVRGPGTPGRLGDGRTAPPVQVRVFIGDRELTDVIRVEVGDTLAPLSRLAKQGAI